jgi:hypothetical protein
MRNRHIFPYVVGLLVSACLFAIINYRNFHRPQDCDDCSFPYGVPFTIYHEGGYGGGVGFVWGGLVGDVVLMLVLGIASGWVFQKISERSSGHYRKM